MTPNEYLKKVLERETFSKDAPELEDLRKRRKEVRDLLLKHFVNSNPSIRWAGSMVKGTMVKESYDGDVTCYFSNDEEPESSLENLYDEAENALQEDYLVERKPSALRISDKSPSNRNVDLHIDVVPGRFTDETQGDVFLHRTTGDKKRLKTNLQVHIDHVKGSGVVDAIRLGKIWNCRHEVGAKTFVLELLIIKLLEEKKTASLADQMLHVWTEMRDNAANLTVEDPANPNGNDLTPILNECRTHLSSVARTTLANIESLGWASVFGEVEEEEGDDGEGGSGKKSKAAALSAAVTSVRRPTKPWLK